MTKKIHRCDESCEPSGTGIHNVKSNIKVKTVKRTPTPNRVKTISNVYSADYALIDNTIEEIKKVSRGVSVTEYSTNNVYLILQDALKKVRLAEK